MKDFSLFMCAKGNGITCANRAKTENGDLQTVAHISPAGNIKTYADDIPEEARQRIEATAAIMREKTRAELARRLEFSKYYKGQPDWSQEYAQQVSALQEALERSRVLDEIGDRLPLEAAREFFAAFKEAGTKEQQNALIIDAYLRIM